MKTSSKNRFTVQELALAGLMAAVMCIAGPFAVPIGPVPVSLTNLVVFFAVFLLGARLGTASVAVYLLLGAVGLPVFSGFVGGLAKLAGPTGGYLIGFLPMAVIGGLFAERFAGKLLLQLGGMALAAAVDYVFGTVWFVVIMQCTWAAAFASCVAPFLVFDAVKLIAACLLASMLRRRLTAAGLFGKTEK